MLRLMIVDDEQIIREALSSMIDYTSLGYEVIATAKNGMEAYDRIRDDYPDVVITDIKMPILNGLELIERASRIDSRITFILLSGYGEFEYAKQAMTYGVRYYLLKPTDKQELINCLDTIREEKKQKEVQQKAEQALLLKDMQSPLEQGLLMEALDQPDNFPQVFKKYQGLLSFPEKGLYACICSFVEETYLKSFLKDIVRILLSCGAESVFPVIYVKNSALFVLSSPTLAHQETIRQSLEELHYPQQCVTFETSFLHGDTSEDLFAQIISKISRYERILLIRPETGETRDFHNNMAAPWRISKLREAFTASPAETDIPSLLDSVFTPSMTPDVAKNIALGLFLNPDNSGQEPPLDIACDFFRRLYSCTQTSEIRKLAEIVLLQEKDEAASSKGGANISLLKSYVEAHLDCETLSLKWLAENYLFVSVGYLSKQFVKEEGIRFSDYLNKSGWNKPSALWCTIIMTISKLLPGLWDSAIIHSISARYLKNIPAILPQSILRRWVPLRPPDAVSLIVRELHAVVQKLHQSIMRYGKCLKTAEYLLFFDSNAPAVLFQCMETLKLKQVRFQ